jgi:hypothetical protein
MKTVDANSMANRGTGAAEDNLRLGHKQRLSRDATVHPASSHCASPGRWLPQVAGVSLGSEEVVKRT